MDTIFIDLMFEAVLSPWGADQFCINQLGVGYSSLYFVVGMNFW